MDRFVILLSKRSIKEIMKIPFKGQNDFDKSFTRFSKFVLGVHSKASNFAALSELDQYPFGNIYQLRSVVSIFGCILCNLMIIHLLIKHIESSVFTQTVSR